MERVRVKGAGDLEGRGEGVMWRVWGGRVRRRERRRERWWRRFEVWRVKEEGGFEVFLGDDVDGEGEGDGDVDDWTTWFVVIRSNRSIEQ